MFMVHFYSGTFRAIRFYDEAAFLCFTKCLQKYFDDHNHPSSCSPSVWTEFNSDARCLTPVMTAEISNHVVVPNTVWYSFPADMFTVGALSTFLYLYAFTEALS